MEPMEDFLALILQAEPEPRMPMKPGMHGKLKAKGGCSAEEMLMKIKKMICAWEAGQTVDMDDEMGDDMKMKKPEKNEQPENEEEDNELQESSEERESEGKRKEKRF